IFPSVSLFFSPPRLRCDLHSFPTRRSSDLRLTTFELYYPIVEDYEDSVFDLENHYYYSPSFAEYSGKLFGLLNNHLLSLKSLTRSEEHTSELQSRFDLVCRLLLEKKKINPE